VRQPVRTVAVDWSGARAGAERKIWLADARDGVVVRLECGRSQETLVAHVIDEARRTPALAVGLDFGFAFPAWYMRTLGCEDAPSLWRRMAAGEGERLLAACAPPFWGRAGSRKPTGCVLYRRDELTLRSPATPLKSVFQVGGAGAVGTGSIRGMAALYALREGGFRIWPFDDAVPGGPVAVEIYPRAFTGSVVKSRPEGRRAGLAGRAPQFARPELLELAAASEDAFDAAISALAMSAAADELARLPHIGDAEARLEGLIWRPGVGG